MNSDPYCVMEVSDGGGSKHHRRTETIKKNLNPTWDAVFDPILLTHVHYTLTFRIMDANDSDSDVALGLVKGTKTTNVI